MEDIVIHIGLPKTGSTFIQDKVLSKSEDIFYVGRPYTQEGLAFNMIQYCDDTIFDEEAVQSEIDELKRRADGRRIVISDELLAGSPLYGFRNRSSIAKRLSRYFPEARIVLCIRNQIDLLSSYFKQITAMGWSDTTRPTEQYVHSPGDGLEFEDWKAGEGWDRSRRFVDHASLMCGEYFKYSSVYNLYSEIFGNVDVILFEDFVRKKEDFFEVWEKVSNVEKKEILNRSKRKVNKSYSLRAEMASSKVKNVADIFGLGYDELERLSLVFFENIYSSKMDLSHVINVIEKSKIPVDNLKLKELGVDNLRNYEDKYIIEC
jgi:hypothetical protein